MGNDLTKIEKLGLEEHVQQLMVSGKATTARSIGKALRDEGHDISDSAVNRYVNKKKEGLTQKSQQILEEHLQKELPKDLEQLESWQKLLHGWALENPTETADRLAAGAEKLNLRLEEFHSLLVAPRDNTARLAKDPLYIERDILSWCLKLLLKDARLQEQRTRAMLAGLKIIEAKVVRGGIPLDGAKQGRIVIIDRSKDYDPDGDKPESSQRKTVSFKVAASHGERIEGGEDG